MGLSLVSPQLPLDHSPQSKRFPEMAYTQVTTSFQVLAELWMAPSLTRHVAVRLDMGSHPWVQYVQAKRSVTGVQRQAVSK